MWVAPSNDRPAVRGPAYAPMKLPGRRSATARMPSAASLVPRSHFCLASSRSVATETASAEPLPHRRPHGSDRQRRVLRDLPGQPRGFRAQVFPVGEYVHQADLERLLPIEAPPGIEHQVGGLLPDQARQGHRKAEALVDAEFDEVGSEPRLGSGDAEVGHQREAQAAADGGALNGADDRGLVREEAHRFPVEAAGGIPESILAKIAPLGAFSPPGARVGAGKVGSGTERLALGRQHDGAAIGAVVQHLESVPDLADKNLVEEVVRRPAESPRWPRSRPS